MPTYDIVFAIMTPPAYSYVEIEAPDLETAEKTAEAMLRANPPDVSTFSINVHNIENFVDDIYVTTVGEANPVDNIVLEQEAFRAELSRAKVEEDVKQDIREAAKLGIYSPAKVKKMLDYIDSHLEEIRKYRDSMRIEEISALISDLIS